MDNYAIILARPEHAEALSQLAHDSKRSWGYPEAWISQWKEDLSISIQEILSNPTFILINDNELIGFCSIEKSGAEIEINHMWIVPGFMNKGLGFRLITHALNETLSPDIHELKVLSDPNAVPFYSKLGFKTFKWVDSLPEGRKLPYMRTQSSTLREIL